MSNQYPKVEVTSTSCCTPQRPLSCATDSVGICGRDEQGTIRNIRTDSAGRLDVTATDLDIRNLNCSQDSVSVCGQGVDSASHNLETDSFGSISTIPNASAYSQIGRLFSIGDVTQNLMTGTLFKHFLFENPATNTKTMYLDKIISGVTLFPATQPLTYEGHLVITINGDVTVETPGSPRTAVPLNLGFSTNSTIVITEDSDISGFGKDMFFARQLNERQDLDLQGGIIVPPGHNLLIAFEVNSIEPQKTLSFSFTITYFEV